MVKVDVASAPDLFYRDFDQRGLNEFLVADISNFQTGERRFYLAGVKDLGSGALVGWAIGDHQVTELVIDAFVMAVERRDLSGKVVHRGPWLPIHVVRIHTSPE